MAQLLGPADGDDYVGLGTIFEYTNHDGRHVPYNCGQAAACTYLTHLGETPADAATFAAIEAEHPPNIMFGYFGTSRGRVERILRKHGYEPERIHGEAALRERIGRGEPVMVMLGVPGPKVGPARMPSGHWMVAYGYDEDKVFLTNWGTMDWAEFRTRWKKLVPLVIRMRGRGIAVSRPTKTMAGLAI